MTLEKRKAIVAEIEARVRPTICPTFNGVRQTIEGRIGIDDFEALIILAIGEEPKQ